MTNWTFKPQNTTTPSFKAKNLTNYNYQDKSTSSVLQDFLLKEDGDFLLLESGDFIILEQSPSGTTTTEWDFRTKS